MRTKTLLLGAAALAAGVATSMAANVYSVNVVGYINVTVQPGYNIIANQLDVDGVDSISTVLNGTTPASQDSALVLKFSSAGFSTDTYLASLSDGGGFVGWADAGTGNPSTNTIPPGVGFFYYNPASSNVTLTLTGSVLQGTNSVQLAAGYSLISVIAPQAIVLDTTATNNFPAGDSDIYLSWANGTFNTSDVYLASLSDGGGFVGWADSVSGNQVYPTPAVGQGFFYYNNGSAKTWTRNFQVQ